MRFSQRIGKVPTIKLVQRESIDSELRNSLWSLLCLVYWDSHKAPHSYSIGGDDYVKGSNLEPLLRAMWLHHFKLAVDTIDPYWSRCLERIRRHFFETTWHQVFDLVEFVAEHGDVQQRELFLETCNKALERENSAYRFVDGQITEITSQEEIQEVENAIDSSEPFSGVRTHLQAALYHLSDRSRPDYRNSIKESISAVESLAKQLADEHDSTLGAILNTLEKSHSLHPALRKAFSALYGYSNDAQGIRHALMDQATLTKADARFMLVCCSAFVNFAIESLTRK